MIPTAIAAKEVGRLAQMWGYPKGEKEALQELISALQVAKTADMAKAVVGGFLEAADSTTRCPMPAEVRRKITELSEEKRAAFRCAMCHGSTWVSIDFLVTYYAGEYRIKKRESLEGKSLEYIAELRGKLGENQAIIGASKPCLCMRPDHKYLTGERE